MSKRTTDSRSDCGPGDGQARGDDDRARGHPAAGRSRSKEEGIKDDQSRQGQERVVAGESDESPVAAERPTRSGGQLPGTALSPTGGHKEQQVVEEKKSVGTQTYTGDETRAHVDLPQQSPTGAEGTCGARYGQQRCNPPIQESCPPASQLYPAMRLPTPPQSIHRVVSTTCQTGAGIAPDQSQVHSPPGNLPAHDRQQTSRKEASIERRGEPVADDRQGQVPVGRQGGEPGADDRQGEVPVGRQGGEPGADDRQGQVPVGRQGGGPGADDRQGQVPAATHREADAETRPLEGGERVRTSVETQTDCQEINAERCTASVKLLLDCFGDDAQTAEHKEHIIHEMSQGSGQVLMYKTAHGLALHVLKQQTWKINKLWSCHKAESNRSEAGVHNVLRELEHHNKKIGHVVEYFSLDYSKRLDIIRLIQKIHDKCDFCETIYNSVT